LVAFEYSLSCDRITKQALALLKPGNVLLPISYIKM
jgi:hypothetical protein